MPSSITSVILQGGILVRNLFVCIAAALVVSGAMPAGAGPEFRAFWVDAYHTGIQTQADIDQLMATARATNCNAVVVQVRRSGDAYFPSPYEPWAPNATPVPRLRRT